MLVTALQPIDARSATYVDIMRGKRKINSPTQPGFKQVLSVVFVHLCFKV